LNNIQEEAAKPATALQQPAAGGWQLILPLLHQSSQQEKHTAKKLPQPQARQHFCCCRQHLWSRLVLTQLEVQGTN
jgi:hypothetical protein